MALPRWYVAGNTGTLTIQDWNCDGTVIRAKETEEKWEEEIVYTKAGPTKTMAPRRKDTVEEIKLAEPDTDYAKTYHNLIDCIEGKGQILVKPEEAMRVMKVMEASFLSHETGKAIEVNI
jgi:predicted dehydrogenase